MALPSFVVLKSVYNQKYLSLTKIEGVPAGAVRFDGEEVTSPLAKFELERAKNDEDKAKGLVHIRCCYNNKYWVRNLSGIEGNQWIVAGAQQPEEDHSKISCTLFEPIAVVHSDDGDIRFKFRHVQLGYFTCLMRIDPPMGTCLYLYSEQPDKDLCDVYTVVRWESLVMFPQHVTFKGDNGKYLCARWLEGHPYHKFAEAERDETAEYEVFTTGNGFVRIKSVYFGKFWRRSPNWIWADSSDESSEDPDVLFWPVKVDKNVVALRNLGNNYFCKRLTTEGKESCLNAGTPTISSISRLVVEELVISRTISEIDFLVLNARTYDENLITLATGSASNQSYGTEVRTFSLKFTYKDVKTSNWSANISFKLGVKTTLQVSAIPLILDGKIEISTEVGTGYQWGQIHTIETALESTYTVAVPPRTRTSVGLVATKASCDVPFSYTQTDVLSNGKIVMKRMDDGIYTGNNIFHFTYDEKQEAL